MGLLHRFNAALQPKRLAVDCKSLIGCWLCERLLSGKYNSYDIRISGFLGGFIPFSYKTRLADNPNDVSGTANEVITE